jgi:hypothetical protein
MWETEARPRLIDVVSRAAKLTSLGEAGRILGAAAMSAHVGAATAAHLGGAWRANPVARCGCAAIAAGRGCYWIAAGEQRQSGLFAVGWLLCVGLLLFPTCLLQGLCLTFRSSFRTVTGLLEGDVHVYA